MKRAIRAGSIISRILTLHVIAIGVTSLFIPLALHWLLNAAANGLLQKSLEDNAKIIASYITLQEDGKLLVEFPSGIKDLYSSSYGRYLFAILNKDGRVLMSSLPGGAAIFPAGKSTPDGAAPKLAPGSGNLYGVTVEESAGGRRFLIQIAENADHRDVLIDDIVRNFFPHVGWIIFPILFTLLAIDVAIFRGALKPLLRASQMAETIGPAATDVRLPAKDVPAEVLPLIRTVNAALDRLEQGFKAQQEFTANAAHELRTPLAILQMRVNSLPASAAAQELRRDVANMTRIVSQLLEIAELGTFVVAPDDKADLKQVCAEVIALLAPLALAQHKEMALEAPDAPVWIRGNAEALSRAIRNLAENAITHTPTHTTVELTVTADGAVIVADHGPGIADKERLLIYRRFWRRDRRKSGAGLGLSIVQSIVGAHAGIIDVECPAEGGARFSLSFSGSVIDDIGRPTSL
jgi:signal transduction histidine kinase